MGTPTLHSSEPKSGDSPRRARIFSFLVALCVSIRPGGLPGKLLQPKPVQTLSLSGGESGLYEVSLLQANKVNDIPVVIRIFIELLSNEIAFRNIKILLSMAKLPMKLLSTFFLKILLMIMVANWRCVTDFTYYWKWRLKQFAISNENGSDPPSNI